MTLKEYTSVDPFSDQRDFMIACGQTVDTRDLDQFSMYLDLIDEEVGELHESIANNDEVETLDALVDILVVTIAAIHSFGADANGAWREVMRSNMAKIDADTGKVIKRADGKILKPVGWTPPQLRPYLSKQQ